MKLKHGLALLVLTILGTLVFSGSSAQAATFTVAAGSDENTTNSSCALSEAIENINDAANTNTDCSPSGAYGTNDTINLPSGTITLTANLPELQEDLSIIGQGKATSIIDGGSTSYSGFITATDVNLANFSAEGFTIRDALGAFGVCSTEVTLDQLTVDNSVAGAIFSCSADSTAVNFVSVTDSEFVNNADGESAGLYLDIDTAAGCSRGSIGVNLTRVRANNNSAEDATSIFGGIFVAASNGCDPPFTNEATFEDVEANDNTSSAAAGFIYINDYPDAIISANRLSANDNVVSGQIQSLDGGPANTGITLYNFASATVTNVTVAGNQTLADTGSAAGGSGLVVMALSVEADIEITNATVTDNSLTGSTNISNIPVVGMFASSSSDFTSFFPSTITNLLAANNTIDATPLTCIDSVNFGGGPIEVPINSGGGNVVEDNTCAYGLNESTDQNNVSGLFATLAAPAYNDGFVETVALLEGSPAIDAGVAVPFSLDAQQVSRSQGAGVDAGAYESPFGQTSSGGGDSASGGELAESGANQVIAITLASAMLAAGTGIASRLRTRYQLSRR